MKMLFPFLLLGCTQFCKGQTIEIIYNRYQAVEFSFNKKFQKKASLFKSKMFFSDSLSTTYSYSDVDRVKEDQPFVGDTVFHHGIFFDFKEKEIFYGSHNFKDIYLIRYDSATINDWKITDQRKVILGYNCLAAEAFPNKWHKIIVWYTTEMKYTTGSFLYPGIPGTVLEVFDQKNGEHFKAISVRERKIVIVKPSTGLTISSKAFNEMWKIERLRL